MRLGKLGGNSASARSSGGLSKAEVESAFAERSGRLRVRLGEVMEPDLPPGSRKSGLSCRSAERET
jgi:hypothetical protein